MKHEFSYYFGWPLIICAFLVGMFMILFSPPNQIIWQDEVDDELVDEDEDSPSTSG